MRAVLFFNEAYRKYYLKTPHGAQAIVQGTASMSTLVVAQAQVQIKAIGLRQAYIHSVLPSSAAVIVLEGITTVIEQSNLPLTVEFMHDRGAQPESQLIAIGIELSLAEADTGSSTLRSQTIYMYRHIFQAIRSTVHLMVTQLELRLYEPTFVIGKIDLGSL